jgi:outer membrane protein assembly factor BamB
MKELTMGMRSILMMAIALGMLAAAARAANDWPQWRGPALNGSSEATGLPEALDVNKNLAWQIKLPGLGSATPVFIGDRLFVSCWDEESKKLFAVCLSRADGKTLWQKEVGLSTLQMDRNNAASPSPVTDGKSVYFYYASGDLVAFDMDGKPLWQRNIQKDYGQFNVNWIYASSPLLYKGKLYVQVIHRDVPPRGPRGNSPIADSYVLAIDPANGKTIWKQERPSDAAQESKESYGTPMPLEYEGRSEIIIVGGDCVTAHDSQTGKELWRAGGWNPQRKGDWRLVPSATVDEKDGLVFACVPKNGPVMAVKDGGHGDVTATGFAWKTTTFTSDVCVPLLYRGNLYILDGDRKTMTCADPKTGDVKWTGSLGGRAVFRASPTAADGKIYCMNQAGEIWVLAADQFKILSKTSFPAKLSNSTIIVGDGQVIVRVLDALYAFKK